MSYVLTNALCDPPPFVKDNNIQYSSMWQPGSVSVVLPSVQQSLSKMSQVSHQLSSSFSPCPSKDVIDSLSYQGWRCLSFLKGQQQEIFYLPILSVLNFHHPSLFVLPRMASHLFLKGTAERDFLSSNPIKFSTFIILLLIGLPGMASPLFLKGIAAKDF